MNTLARKMTATTVVFTALLGVAALSVSYAAEPEGAQFGIKAEQAQHRGIMKDITRSVEKTATGAIITITSDNADAVEKLQSNNRKHPEKEGITHTVVNISNGVQVTVSATDSETITKLQDHAEKGGKRGAKKGKGKAKGEHRGDRKAFRDEVTKAVENIDNGAIVTLTSDNSEVVTKLQEKEPRASKNETVSVSKVDLSNGVQITITSTDSDTVERIQKVSERKKSHRFTQK